MDYLSSKSRVRISDLAEAKRRGERWAMLTSYDATSAKLFDLAKIPVLLVGDSAAQAVLGYRSTIPITMDEMIPLARAVASSCQRALVIGDMPFASYQESAQVALRNAARFMKEAQVHGVKMEGGAEIVEQVKLLSSSGIPVMAHVGLTPQAEHALSGYKVQGRGADAMEGILQDTLALQEAGAFAVVVEVVPSAVGRLLQSKLRIPVISIGAGPYTDAQIVVWTDMVGFSPPKGLAFPEASRGQTASSSAPGTSNGPQLELSRVPKFVRRYTNVSEMIFKAACEFAADVRLGKYPAEENCYE